MPRWDHTIKVKDLFQQDAEDHDEVACQIGPIAAERVKKLAARVAQREPFLSADLDDIADALADVQNEESPQEAFNDALASLYDLGDRHRIWVA